MFFGAKMIREATAMTVRQNLGELLNEVQYRHDSVLITKGGKPVAAMVDVALFEKIRVMRDDFDIHCAEIAASFKELPQDKGLAIAEEAASWARKKTRKRG